MRKNEKQGLKELSVQELQQKANEIRHQIFNIKITKMSAPVKDVMLVKKLKRSLACVLTFLKQKESVDGN